MMQPTSWSAGWARMALAVQRRIALAARREVGSTRDVISTNVCVPFSSPKDLQASHAGTRS
jgi:hypothetical protein